MTRHKAELLAIEYVPTKGGLYPVKIALMLQADKFGDYSVVAHVQANLHFDYQEDRERFEGIIGYLSNECQRDTTALCSHCSTRKPHDSLHDRAVGKVCRECQENTSPPQGYYTIGHDGVIGHGVS